MDFSPFSVLYLGSLSWIIFQFIVAVKMLNLKKFDGAESATKYVDDEIFNNKVMVIL